MDYLDTRKELRHRIILLTGYMCIAVAISIATLVLLYQAYGFGIGKQGTVIQNGLLFFSSQPSSADVYIDGKRAKQQTNFRMPMPEGVYDVTIARDGYRDWQRKIELDGGSVRHFDYPLLVPEKLSTKTLGSYEAAPAVSTQSPDRRWLLVAQANSFTDFNVYDFKNPAKAPVSISLPDGVMSAATTSQSLEVAEWSADNDHVLLRHIYDGKTEYILVNRPNPDQSVNLSKTLSTDAPGITLKNRKYDQYFVFQPSTGSLQTASLKEPTLEPFLERVLSYKSYGNNDVLYTTDLAAPKGKVLVRLKAGDTTYTIRNFPAGATSYPLDLTEYSGSLYMVSGSSNDGRAYIYKDPIGQARSAEKVTVPTQVLRVPNMNSVSFSSNAQFIAAESGQNFGVYDIENEQGYNFTSPYPLDAPQTKAAWMDGNRLTYVSGGKLVFYDYDNVNRINFVPALSGYLPAYDPDYKYIYTLSPGKTAGQIDVNQTALLTPADL